MIFIAHNKTEYFGGYFSVVISKNELPVISQNFLALVVMVSEIQANIQTDMAISTSLLKPIKSLNLRSS